LVGGYMLPSFFATCKIKDESISTRFLMEDSFFERSTIELVVSKPRKTFHSSNAFFAHSSTCLLILRPPLFTLSTSFSSRSRNQFFKIGSLIGELGSIPSLVSYLKNMASLELETKVI
jgi:hypothetical protein